MFHKRSKSRNVEEDSLVGKKTETKKQLKQKLDERPEQKVLEDRGILPKQTEDKKKSGGSRKESSSKSVWGSKGKESNGDLLSKDEKGERRKSSVFSRTKSNKLSLADMGAQSVIGMSVTEACEREGGAIPRIVELCVAYLYKAGFEEAGIFRVSGDKTRIDHVVAEFDRGNPSPLDGVEDVHTVTSLLKLFFRLAPAPLFTVEAHAALLGALSNDAQRSIAAYVDLLRGLPGPCLKTILVLFPMLRAVADRSEVNMMSPNNLGIVFGPTLLRSAAELAGEVDMSNRSAYTVEFLVTHWAAIQQGLTGSSAATSLVAPARNSSSAASPTSPSAAAGAASVAAAPPPIVAGAPPANQLPPPPTKIALVAAPSVAAAAAAGGPMTPIALRKGPPPIPNAASSGNVTSTPPQRRPSVSEPPPAFALPPPPAAAPVAAVAAASGGFVGSPMQQRRPLPGGVVTKSAASLPLPPPPAAVLAAAAPPPVVVAAPAPAAPAGKPAVALYNFSGDATKGQTDLVKGAAVTVLVEHAAGWSTIECNGKTGFVPSSYIK